MFLWISFLVTCHMSHVTCRVSHVTCHMSFVTCHMSPFSHINLAVCNLVIKSWAVVQPSGFFNSWQWDKQCTNAIIALSLSSCWWTWHCDVTVWRHAYISIQNTYLRALHTSAICSKKHTKFRNTNVRVQFSCKLNLPSFFFLSCCELWSDWTIIDNFH